MEEKIKYALNKAFQDAIIYGTGIIAVVHKGNTIEIKHISKEETIELCDHLNTK